MADKIFRQRSIEFQMKVDHGFLAKGTTRREADAALSRKIRRVLSDLAKRHGGEVSAFGDPWGREGIRYDTKPGRGKVGGLFRSSNLSLAIEATAKATKFKCKQHNFIPQLLYVKPGSALSYPIDKGNDVKFKVEQDIHFNNTKFCASGSMLLDGERTDIACVRDFSRLFPAIEVIAPPDTPLHPVSRWQETVVDVKTRWSAGEIPWMLVNRWIGDDIIESELSCKIARAMKDEWNFSLLDFANRIYLELQKNTVFLPDPPIFYYQDPVASVDVRRQP